MDKTGIDTAKNFGLISVPYASADVAILPVPYENSVTYGGGTREGPEAIISASHYVETYDFLKNRNYENMKIATLEPLSFENKSPEEVSITIEKRVAGILEDGKFPLMLGGEHSITVPAVRAVAAKRKIGVIQLDAHADLRHEYDGTIYSHASVMARVRESVNSATLQIGIRSCSLEEGELIKKENLRVLNPSEVFEGDNLQRGLDGLPEEVYLTVDVDCLETSIMPSTGTPEPGGFGWEELNNIISAVAGRKTIVGADVVELAPIPYLHAPDFLTAKLVFNILAEIFLQR